MDSFTDVLFPTGTYTVTRTEAGEHVDGRYASGSKSTFPIVADVQAVGTGGTGGDANGSTLRDLTEGRRAENTLVLYTISELRALDGGTEPDVIEIEGELWRVFRVQRFRVFANRYRVWVERLNATPPVET
jgi:hypothetical protein